MDKLTNQDELFASVEKLLYQQAWAAAQRYKIPYNEALSECYWDFVRASNGRFKEDRGVKFSTFLQYLCMRHFQTIQRKRAKQAARCIEVELNEETVGAAPERHSPCLEAVEGLSAEAREIVGLLLETPAEVVDVWRPVKPQQLLSRVKRYLQRKRGYSKKRLEEAHEEIQTTFRNIWATA